MQFKIFYLVYSSFICNYFSMMPETFYLSWGNYYISTSFVFIQVLSEISQGFVIYFEQLHGL